jgi:hypothetical protein
VERLFEHGQDTPIRSSKPGSERRAAGQSGDLEAIGRPGEANGPFEMMGLAFFT